jgi:hypothetical protein
LLVALRKCSLQQGEDAFSNYFSGRRCNAHFIECRPLKIPFTHVSK